MLILTSPAKTLDFTHPYQVPFTTSATYLKEAIEIMQLLKKMETKELAKVLEVSMDLAELNQERFKVWDQKHTLSNSRPAIVAYQGEIYKQIHENEYTESQAQYLQKSLRIISGLYGILCPYDLIQPYRLEMKVQLKTTKGKNLYQFWGTKLTDFLNKEVTEKNQDLIINLASEEYTKGIEFSKLKARTLHIVFKQHKGDTTFNYGIMARKARGMMIDYMVKNQIYAPEQLEKFDVGGYKYSARSPDMLLFIKEV
jgi:uncharacterized protein